MEKLVFDLTKTGPDFKILNATNGGPWFKRHTNDQFRSNFDDYKAARIPYQRTHDSAVHSVYGGPHSYDMEELFPVFDADVDDPASYDFENTDEAIFCALETGTQTFFRLGQTIEHQVKKHGTIPPKDFHKWALICEHIIRHMNEGWANGHHMGIEYWEIWNEPDLDPDDATNKRTWGGTEAQFYDLFEITAKHLKKCFPHLKIGGPALSGNEEWGERFLCEMQKRNVPMDFFSWHIYSNNPLKFVGRADRIHAMMEKYGYGDAESILNEWNYVQGWSEEFGYSLEMIHGIKGASFMQAVMALSQPSSIDMLMYYDTRPSAFNGCFDFYTYKPLKGYYPMYWYGMFYDMEKYIPTAEAPENVYALCGIGKDGKILSAFTYYNNDDTTPAKTVTVSFGKKGTYEVCLVDETHNGEVVETVKDAASIELEMTLFSCVLIREI